MHATSTIIGISAFAIAALAQDASITFNTMPPHDVTPNSSVDLQFTAPDSSSPVTITLLRGCPSNCVSVGDLTTGATGGDYKWTPASSLQTGCDYGLQIKQGGKMNYSNNFCVQAGSSSSSSSSPATSSTLASSSSAAAPTGYGSASSSAAAPTGYGSAPSSAATSTSSSKPSTGAAAPTGYGSVSSSAAAATGYSKASSSAVAPASSYAPAGPSAKTGGYTATRASTPTPTPSPAGPKYTGAASSVNAGAGMMGLVGVAGLVAML